MGSRSGAAPEVEAVLAANRGFYEAHEQRDLPAMADVWEHSDRVVCVHPGWPILRTWAVVEQSWRGIFDGPGRLQFILTNESVAIDGDIAWVTLEENLLDAAMTGTVGATNVFARVSGAWKLVVHHASPIMAGG